MRLSEILKPFKENVESMQRSIKEYYENGIKDYVAENDINCDNYKRR